MGRPKEDEFWNHVESVDKSLKCKYCGNLFPLSTSISRIKYHLSGEPGGGVRSCKRVPDNVRSKAYETIQELNKRRKIMPSSSSNPSSRQQNDQVEIRPTPCDVQALGHEVLPETATSFPYTEVETFTANNAGETGQDQAANASVPFEFQSPPFSFVLHDYERALHGGNENFTANNAVEIGQDPVGNASIQFEVAMPSSSSNPSSRQQNDQMEIEPTPCGVQAPVHDVLPEMATSLAHAEVETVTANNAGEIGQDQVGNASIPNEVEESGSSWIAELLDKDNAAETLQYAFNAAETGQDSGEETFLTTELVGQKFQINKNRIWACLMNDGISSIGIYGMGGSGKTTLMKHIHNQLKEKHLTVYWITVSQDFGIYRLQTLIAESIKLDLSNERDIIKRAAKLWKALKEKQKCVLILDDLWDHFDLKDVGIPKEANGCKLVLTTRLLDVCNKMCCEEKIQVVPLNKNEAWRLFEVTLGASLPSGVTDIAKLIAEECDGLPLGIITMAGVMRGVDDICEWRNALKELKESQVSDDDMNNKVFSVLKFSYNRLTDSALQQCFLYCALYPEDHIFKIKELIEHLIDEEIIQEESMQAAFDKGHTMLNRLKRVCLFERLGSKIVKMHDLIRDMAIQIIKEKGGVMIKAGAQLEEIPDCEKWIENLVKVSLASNKIKEIPPDFSPWCPKLSTLLLCGNFLRKISNSFFKQLNGLKVLDLSHTDIEELPNSISDLKSLHVLLLSFCERLRHVPSLSKLKALKKLDLYKCRSVAMLPQGIEVLSNLRHLNLLNTDIEEFPVGILPGLLNLQVLKLLGGLKGEEVAFLRKLETLMCSFHNTSEFKSLPPNLKWYTLKAGETGSWAPATEDFEPCDRNLFIVSCYVTAHFLSFSSSFPSLFQNLQSIYLHSLNEENAAAALPLSLPCSTLSQLKEFSMFYCNTKKLFPPGLVSNFQNLERLVVSKCFEMEEIIATGEEYESRDNIQFVLPKLKLFSLYLLPNLKSICRGDIICNSLVEIRIVDCEKLSRVPLSLLVTNNESQFSRLPSLVSMEVLPREWWERVELVHPNPNAKNILSPICGFI